MLFFLYFSFLYVCFTTTYCRLSKRALVGDTSIYVQDSINWEVGQKLVLVTTATRDDRLWHQNEVFTIASIQPFAGTGAVIGLNSPIQYNHIARSEYQAEVGLLSRSITIQGAANDSEPTDTTPASCTPGDFYFGLGYEQLPCPNTYLTGYGGHVIVHSGGVGYVEGVELYRMGQTNVMGKYPMVRMSEVESNHSIKIRPA
jgi:hypothetical protein